MDSLATPRRASTLDLVPVPPGPGRTTASRRSTRTSPSMTTTPEVTNPLLAELRRVHDMLRRDLRTCGALADAATAGAPTDQLRDELGRLASRSPLFQLKVNCL